MRSLWNKRCGWASGEDAAFASGASRAAAQSGREGTRHDRAAPGRRSDMLIPQFSE